MEMEKQLLLAAKRDYELSSAFNSGVEE